MKPYIAKTFGVVVPIRILDLYRYHIMESVVSAVEDLGVYIEHIPGGCTG